ncbi:hypothetical protein B0H34DRAFT_794372 [Crassisporium funariophilum]|nr:hypothetical protein B0H34DRAFT_794372 [Crassisporium funariophilum]
MTKLQEMIAPGAFHNSGDRYDPPKCHPHTRLAILKAIMSWVETVCQTYFIMWLYGPAGSGKSAIAQTIAEHYHALGLLAGSFFFGRNAPGRNDSSRIISTLAYQLLTVIPEMRCHVENTLQLDPMVFCRSLEAQMDILIVRPLAKVFPAGKSRSESPKARLIIIDGLDECRDQCAQQYILTVIRGSLERLPITLVFLIVSRSEQHIRTSFNMQSLNEVTTTLALNNTYESNADIMVYLTSAFDNIKATHTYQSQIPPEWPSRAAVQCLVQKSSGQFVYAATVVKYVASSRHWPTKRLDIILGHTSCGRDTPFAELDNLYTLILDQVEETDEVLQVLSLLILEQSSSEPKTMKLVETLFSHGLGELYRILFDLHSILYVPSFEDAANPWRAQLRLFHASLGDFLMDRSRSGKYFIDAGAAHAMLAMVFLRHIPARTVRTPQLDSCEKLSCDVFIEHCCLASPTRTLFECLFQHDLYHLFSYHRMAGPGTTPIPDLFQWFEKQTFILKSNFPGDESRNSLHEHHLRTWDTMMLDFLKPYSNQTFNRLFLAAVACDAFLDFSHGIIEVILHGSEDPIKSQYAGFIVEGVGMTGFNSAYALPGGFLEYHSMVKTFLTDARRSGRYHINGDAYRSLAESLIHYLKSRTNQPKGADLIDKVMQLACCGTYLPLLLSHSDFSTAFETHLRSVAPEIERAQTFGNETKKILDAIKAYSSLQGAIYLEPSSISE